MSDDRYINRKYRGKIIMVEGALVYYKTPSLRDYARQKRRYYYSRRFLEHLGIAKGPEEKVKGVLARDMRQFKNLSQKAKAGFVASVLAEAMGFASSLWKRKDVWPTIKSTKTGHRLQGLK